MPDPSVLAMPGMPTAHGISVAADGKSFSVKAGNWTWHMTPTEVSSR